jgi:uncharacterized protein (TIGR00255 family)
MTGFGTYEQETPRWVQNWEIRSVNGKQLAIRWKIPPSLFALQEKWEKRVRAKASRGRVDISLILQSRTPEDLGISLNASQARAMLARLKELATEQGDVFAPDYNRFLTIPHLWQESAPPPNDELASFLDQGLEQVLSDWNGSRKREGEAMAADLHTRLETIASLVDKLKRRAPRVKEERFALVRDRVSELLSQTGAELDESRMQQEIVYLADKLDVSEELTRLDSHLTRLREQLAAGGEMGRRLDFLLQESFREITTCGNKIQDVEAGRLVVDCKVELEKCREQVQNIE